MPHSDVTIPRAAAREENASAAAGAPQPPVLPGPPPAPELASILILCCNQLDYTQMCLDSVLRYTRSPYELIVVDNGSQGLHRPGHGCPCA